jgi:hypothetical protein
VLVDLDYGHNETLNLLDGPRSTDMRRPVNHFPSYSAMQPYLYEPREINKRILFNDLLLYFALDMRWRNLSSLTFVQHVAGLSE